jgi:hypothetical protein
LKIVLLRLFLSRPELELATISISNKKWGQCYKMWARLEPTSVEPTYVSAK